MMRSGQAYKSDRMLLEQLWPFHVGKSNEESDGDGEANSRHRGLGVLRRYEYRSRKNINIPKQVSKKNIC